MAAGRLFQAFSIPKIREILVKSRFLVMFGGFRPWEWSQTLWHLIFIHFAPLNAQDLVLEPGFDEKLQFVKSVMFPAFFLFLASSGHGLGKYFGVRHFILPISFKSPLEIISSSIFL